MKPLSGWLFVIVGIFIGIMSKYIENFQFFYWVGLGFLAIGMFKLLIKYIFRKKQSKADKRVLKQQQHYWEQQHKLQKQQIEKQRRGHYCPRCRSFVVQGANFCHYCGKRLR